MKSINIEIKNKPTCYEIKIDNNIIFNLKKFLSENHFSRLVLIHDLNINSCFIESIIQIDDQCLIVPLEINSSNKTIEQFYSIHESLNKNNIDKSSLIIALGGGSIGDLVGFIASTFHRGVSYIQIPTTLLSMIDSSIGGKTGLDLDYGKNLIGSFHHPKAVFIDTTFLKTLSSKEMHSGVFEIIKYGIAFDSKLFYFIRDNKNHLFEKNILNQIIEWCCKIKSNIIMKDERDSGIRNKLNFGHTIGHAIESLYKIRHGEAIGIGMIYAANLSKKLHSLEEDKHTDIIDLINFFNPPILDIDIDDIIEIIKNDKKRINDKYNFILLNDIGSSYISDKIKTSQLKDILRNR
ncbi:MAG: 3-dehydroquinate synthase [Candidatus Marinimicrobia bacterium]|nr:3-dehydroquinate synthase [Candidatus Neomarinimicrobiota bacterium]|tara:strand:- start:6130 stop:7179 length:1050 start_codon:yes stop_codon:yes gene_type:complete